MNTRLAKLANIALFVAISALVASCAAYRDKAMNQPSQVTEIESELAQAGFRKVPIQTSQQHTAVADLRLYRLNQYQSTQGKVFWYADPSGCKCLFEGDQAAYERYADALKQQTDTAAYAKYGQPQEVADLSPFGDAFPPPLMGWPMVIDFSGGPIQSAGGGFPGSAGAVSPAGAFGGSFGGAGFGGGSFGSGGHSFGRR
jgi:uncharacterized membrane protein YgcG